MNVKYKIILAMLVLAIFTVGCVSAEENVTADIDVPTEEAVVDDAVVEDVESEDAAVDADVADEVENLRSGEAIIYPGDDSDDVNRAINNSDYVLFTTSTYYNMYNLTLKNNTVVDGNGSTLVGNGVDDIFLTYNCNNVTIKNFILNVNGAKHGIYGSYVTNSEFKNNEIFNGKDGININKYYDNLTIEDNKIYSMSNDGISLANPITYSDISNLGYTNISRNVITNIPYAIFIGGNFKGKINNNNISNCIRGLEFVGKPNGQMGNIMGEITNNIISSGQYGIEFTNETIVGLTMGSNTIMNMNYGINMYNTTISNSSISSNTFTNMGEGINMNNITTNGLTIISNAFTNMDEGIDIVGGTLNGLTIESNNITYVDMGIGMDDTIIASVTIAFNRIITNHFSDHYAIWNSESVTKTTTGTLYIYNNYLYGCINHSLEILSTYFGGNTGQVIVY